MSNCVVVSYNIQHGRGMDGHFDLNRTTRILAALNPDIMLVQEADCRRPQTQMTCQPGQMAQTLNMNYAYGVVRSYRPGSYGNAILSRYPITAQKNQLLDSKGDHRCCLEVKTEGPKGSFTVFNVHLGLNSEERYRHLKEIIIPRIRAVNGPVLLGGDFNVGPESSEIKLIKNYLQDSFLANSGKSIYTFPANEPSHRIDYIFFNKYWHINEYKIISYTQASDHFPVMANIYIK